MGCWCAKCNGSDVGEILRVVKKEEKDKMIEIMMKLPASIDSTTAGAAATTSGPFAIPAGWPDIAWMPTTTVEAIGAAIIFASTSGGAACPHILNAPSSYTARAFNFKNPRAMDAGAKLVVKYRPVGDLVRT